MLSHEFLLWLAIGHIHNGAGVFTGYHMIFVL